MKSVDIIVPCYNEAEGLAYFYLKTKAVVSAMDGYAFRFLFINDGSKDMTLQVMKDLAAQFQDVSYLSFSRNFGKEAAMYAGLQASDGDYVIIMDADLQHPPELIPRMAASIEAGHDCCAAMRTDRDGESFLRSLFSRSFYWISNHMTDVTMAQGAVDYRMMSRQMVDAIKSLSEKERFSKGIFAWVGFDTEWLPYENVERSIGSSKWSFRGLTRYAINGITSFSVVPLRMLSIVGILISFCAFIYIVVTLVQTMIYGIDVPGYVTTLCAVLFLGGLIELSLGIIGEYLAHIYMESKKRPIYLTKESLIRSSMDIASIKKADKDTDNPDQETQRL